MLKLRGQIQTRNSLTSQPRIVYVTRNAQRPAVMRQNSALLLKRVDLSLLTAEFVASIREAKSFAGLLLCGSDEALTNAEQAVAGLQDVYLLPEDYDYLEEGDIVRLNPQGERISTLFRKNAPSNSILLTERCNNYCLMCSQPPKRSDDSWLVDDALELIRMIPQGTANIGFTGGEPTLLGDRFFELIEAAKLNLPDTALDVLTNGRAFKNEALVARLAQIRHPNLQLGIPLYSDDPARHNYVVQAQGAFDETIHGILNLKRYGLRVEIRLVIHQQTLPRLVQTCEFIARNLLFVDHVALMGLEIAGFTRANLDILWVDPFAYRDALSEAVEVLRTNGMHCSVYNHQLCLVNRDVEDICRKAISDWKNEYLPQCGGCMRKSECGGFFSTQVMYRHSDHIQPFSV